MANWLIPALFTLGFMLIVCTIAWRNTGRKISRTLTNRANPSFDEYRSSMSADVSIGATEFVWKMAHSPLHYPNAKLTLHPEDNLAHDLPIDEEEWALDWPNQWARRKKIDPSNLAEWPKGQPLTVRNYGRWLDAIAR